MRRPVESAQYVSIKYSERLAEAGIEPSVTARIAKLASIDAAAFSSAFTKSPMRGSSPVQSLLAECGPNDLLHLFPQSLAPAGCSTR
ncbi:hypothetical protein ELH85_32420 (plasmid) [Rhizobium ruizarguesonis]|nr:hypothetical protein ELH85_32420 [Rhizobium ruizarguesonis]